MVNHLKDCYGCFACADVCPQKCICMRKDIDGFMYPDIDFAQCINCSKCNKVCPTENIKYTVDRNVEAYVAFSRDKYVRENSSSGGIFRELACYSINCGGVVFGACMSDDLKYVYHKMVKNIYELKTLMGSKYIQSNLTDIYIQIRYLLKKGERVVFCGTPCQVKALDSFVGSFRKNLLLIDFACHGVPSEKVWNRYKEEKEREETSSIQRVSFRKKTRGWNDFSMNLEFENGNVYDTLFSEDMFGKAFLSNVCLRPSCYDCGFKQVQRVSDITLCDCWGIENLLSDPDYCDNKGVSLVLIQSDKGKEIWDILQKEENILTKRVSLNEAVQRNTYLVKSVKKNKNRASFFKELDKYEFSSLVRKYAIESKSVKGYIGDLLRKIGLFNYIYKLVYKVKINI